MYIQLCHMSRGPPGACRLTPCAVGPPRFPCVPALCRWPHPDRYRGLPVLLALQCLSDGVPLSRSPVGLHSRRRGPVDRARPDHGPAALAQAFFGDTPQGSTTGLWLVPGAVELCHAGCPPPDETRSGG